MKNSVAKPAWALLLMSAVLMGNAHARLPSSEAGNPASPGKAKKMQAAKTRHVGQVKFVPGSEETASARSSRLKRECKGGVNAGACAGYTY